MQAKSTFPLKTLLAVSPRTVRLLGMPGLVWLHANKWDLLIHNLKRVQLFKVEHQKLRQSNSAANFDRLLLLICQFPASKHALDVLGQFIGRKIVLRSG